MKDNFIEGDNDDPEPNDKVKIIWKRHTYTIEEKLLFVKLMKKNQKYSIAEEYDSPDKI